MLLLFIRFLLIGKTFMEHRLYGGVFVLQKNRPVRQGGKKVFFYLLSTCKEFTHPEIKQPALFEGDNRNRKEALA